MGLFMEVTHYDYKVVVDTDESMLAQKMSLLSKDGYDFVSASMGMNQHDPAFMVIMQKPIRVPRGKLKPEESLDYGEFHDYPEMLQDGGD